MHEQARIDMLHILGSLTADVQHRLGTSTSRSEYQAIQAAWVATDGYRIEGTLVKALDGPPCLNGW